MSSSISINKNALELTSQILDKPESLGCEILEQKNGATIIDAGVNVSGSEKLALLIAEASLGGLGAVRPVTMHIGHLTIRGVIVSTNEPKIATLGSQHAGWQIRVNDFFAMGSGPARSLYAHEIIFQEIGYRDNSQKGVIILETRQLPSEEVTDYISKKCGILPSDLYAIIVPTASVAGSVQMSARIIELGIHKMWKLGFDISKVKTAHGTAPVAPVAKDNMHAIGITNDCIIYGGRAYYFLLSNENDNLSSLVGKIPSSSSDQYGRTFYDLFKSVEFDFSNIDPLLLSPAEVTLNDIITQKTYRAGNLNPDILMKSLEL